MADRYQDRPFPADDDYDRGDDPHASSRGESDPLAELARLIGQTDPFAGMGRANQPIPPRGAARDPYPPVAEPEPEDSVAAGPPPWMQRAIRQEAPQQDYPSAVHPLQRYATPLAARAPEPDYDQAPAFTDADHESDPSRYDDALYGQLESAAQPAQHDAAYPDDPYGYQDGYDDGAEQQAQKKRRGGMITVVVVLALAVVGTGGAFAYRTYVGSPRSGEPPVIKADSSPTKIVPAPADGSGKVPDRLAAAGDGTEKIVPREEAPVDVNANAKPAGPRMVFPPLNQNANPPSAASVAPGGPMPAASAGNGTLPNNQPRPIKTFSVRGDQPDAAATPVMSAAPPPAAKPAPAARAVATPPPAASTPRAAASAANANASSANAPLSLSPQAAAQSAPPPAVAEPRTRVAANNPVQIAPSASPSATASGGGYLVQVSSQRNEADAQASYRVLQGKFPAVLGSHAPLIKRADLGDKGVYYRAMVGPFGSPDEASQFCGSLKTAGGQCVVQRN
jgi:SPOR domain